jgi:catechol 2,3-dioxygenase-like lactoylglutathione lyase family enzyme
VPAATRFYADVFGMRVVWAPDPDNVYLSSGTDNLALHADPRVTAGGGTLEDVHAAASALRARHVPLAREPAVHRDGSVSCYCRDPDGNLVQILYVPGTTE